MARREGGSSAPGHRNDVAVFGPAPAACRFPRATYGPSLPALLAGGGGRHGAGGGCRGRPAVLLGYLQADQGGGSRLRALCRPAVGEAGQDPGGLPPGAQMIRAAGQGDPGAGPEAANQVARGVGGHVVEELPVDHDDGGVVAGGVALHVLQADLAVRGGLVVGDTQMLAQVGQDLVAAHDRTQGVRADPDVVLADRVPLEHRVEAGHGGHLRLGEPQPGRAVVDAVVGDVALLGLDQVQQRQQGGAGARIAGDDLVRLRVQPGAYFVAERHYLSTPPNTGSMLATAAITSASRPPSAIADTDCRLVNEGSRRCTRNGRVPPSLTTWQPSSPRGDSTAA